MIVKHTSSFEGHESEIMPEMTDEQAAKMLKTMGQEVNDETIKEVKEKMQPGTSNVKMFLTETQTQISSPELTATDFQFALPEGKWRTLYITCCNRKYYKTNTDIHDAPRFVSYSFMFQIFR